MLDLREVLRELVEYLISSKPVHDTHIDGKSGLWKSFFGLSKFADCDLNGAGGFVPSEAEDLVSGAPEEVRVFLLLVKHELVFQVNDEAFLFGDLS